MFIRATAFAGMMLVVGNGMGQEPPKMEVELRMDAAEREELAEEALPAAAADSVSSERPFAFKLNRKRVAEAAAYDAVTLWNVRKVRAKNRRMRLTDTTRREKVRLLKFFTVRDRRKGVRPHLLGNVAGYVWGAGYWQDRRYVELPTHIEAYTLREEYEAARRRMGEESLLRVPDELWRPLSFDAVYVLDGVCVSSQIFQFLEGLFLRTLEIHTDTATMDRYATDRGVVIGDTYPDRRPLVTIGGKESTIAEWLKMCSANVFAMDSELPMHYYYMLPVEAVQRFGLRGRYGAICIELVP